MPDMGQPNETSPSPIRDEGVIGPGGRKFLAVAILLIVLGTGAYYAITEGEEIRDFLEELAEEPGADEDTVTLEDTTIESGEPAAPPQPEATDPAAPDEQLDRARRQLDCISEAAADTDAIARCVQGP